MGALGLSVAGDDFKLTTLSCFVKLCVALSLGFVVLGSWQMMAKARGDGNWMGGKIPPNQRRQRFVEQEDAFGDAF